MSTFIVVMQAASGATFPKGQRFSVDYQGSHGPVKLLFSTTRGDPGLGVETALYLSVTARTEAPSIDEAIAISGGLGNVACALIALAANAAVEPVKVRSAYQLVNAIQDGDYFQRYLPGPQPTFLQHRRVDIPVLQAFFPAFGSHDEIERLIKAIDHYRFALLNARPGQDVIAFSPLWICVEALTPVFLRRELKRTGQSREQLYDSWGLPPSEFQGTRNRHLYGAVRSRLIFHSDQKSYEDAREASDGFEHAYMDLNELRSLVRRTRIPTAAHVRRAIIDLLDLNSEILDVAFGPKFLAPLERWEYDLSVRAKLTPASDGSLARADRGHPEFEWDHPIQSMNANADETISFRLGGNLKAIIAEGARLHSIRFEIRGPTAEPVERALRQSDSDSEAAANDTIGPKVSDASETRLNRLMLVSIMHQILGAAEGVAPHEPVQVSQADRKIYEMFWRARSLFDGIRALIREELPDEAFILAASIYEESLRIGQLRAAGGRRHALALGWIRDTLEGQRHLAATMATRHGEDSAELVSKIDQQIEDIKNFAVTAKIKELESFLAAKEAALHLNREQDYWLYELAQDFARGSHLGQMNRVKKLGDVTEMYARTGDLRIAGGVVEFAGKALLLATIDMAAMFGRGDTAKCQSLIAQLDALDPSSNQSSQFT